MYKSLREFIKILKDNKQLIEVNEEIDTHLEITELHKRMLHENGPALLLKNVKHQGRKSNMPVLVNLFGNIERIAMGMNCDKENIKDIGEALAIMRQPIPPGSIKEAFNMLPLVKKMLNMKPKIVKSAPCQEVVLKGDKIDLNQIPIQTCWPKDAGPLITWPLIVTKGPNKVQDKSASVISTFST